jgi:hypothetical protein
MVALAGAEDARFRTTNAKTAAGTVAALLRMHFIALAPEFVTRSNRIGSQRTVEHALR